MASNNFLKAQNGQKGILTGALTAPFAGLTGLTGLAASANSGASGPFNWKAAGLVILTVALVIFILLVIAHYTIRPIFKTREAGPGIIPIPTVGKDATGIYWTDRSKPLSSADTVLGENDTGTVNYSMAIDILLQDPSVQSAAERPIFWRSSREVPDTPSNPNGPAITQMVGSFNFAVYLANSTNDLVVSVLTTGGQIESVPVANIPVGKPFRLGIILSERFLEVYLNGRLYKTRNLASAPLAVAGSFMPASGPYKDMAVVRNLRLWKGAISPAEMRYLPALPDTAAMQGKKRNTDLSVDLAAQLCGAVKVPETVKNVIREVNPSPALVSASDMPPVLASASDMPPALVSASDMPPVLASASDMPPVLASASDMPPVLASASQ
jgi:hypothetical protein